MRTKIISLTPAGQIEILYSESIVQYTYNNYVVQELDQCSNSDHIDFIGATLIISLIHQVRQKYLSDLVYKNVVLEIYYHFLQIGMVSIAGVKSNSGSDNAG